MTTDGTVLSLGTDDMLALGEKTYKLEPSPAQSQSVFTMPDGRSFTAAPTGGRVVTADGEVVAMGTDERLGIGGTSGKTYSLGVGKGAGASESMGVGGAVTSGFGGGVFEGGAGRGRGRGLGMGIWVGVAVAVGGFFL